MNIRFWGVRGSIPSPGLETLRYGGNTACVSVEIGPRVLVLDAGTGIRSLGHALAENGKEIYILLTHPHADHVMGFPFFAPLYESGRMIHVIDYRHQGHAWSLVDLLDGVFFPMPPERLSCSLHRVEESAVAYLQRQGFDVECRALNHPGGAYGYRIGEAGRTFVHMTDNEIDAPDPHRTPFEAFVDFCRDADVLCHDAQYQADDVSSKRGWGHSTVSRVCDLAMAARVKRLVLFHHDPERTDDELDELQAFADARLSQEGITCTVAYEGLTIEL